jgi:hypothetical protein
VSEDPAPFAGMHCLKRVGGLMDSIFWEYDHPNDAQQHGKGEPGD